MNMLQASVHIATAFIDVLFAYTVFSSIFYRARKGKMITAAFYILGAAVILIDNALVKEAYLRIALYSAFIFLCSLYLFKGKVLTKLFVGLLFNAISQVGDMFIWGIMLLIFPNHFDSSNLEASYQKVFLFGAAAYYIYATVFILLFRLIPIRETGELRKGQALLLTAVPFSSAVLIVYLLKFLLSIQSADYFMYLLPAAFFIGLIFFILLFFKHAQDAEESARALAVYSSQITHFSNEYSLLAQSYRETRDMRHDWKHHLNMMDSLAAGRDEHKLAEYIGGLKSAFSYSKDVYVGDHVVDILLSALASRARECGIDVNIITDILYPLKVSPVDMCVIISNTSDNALEACQKMDHKQERKIWIRVETDENYLVYSIKNTYDGKIAKKGNRYLSSKADPQQHGVGLQSVERVVERYDGYVTITPGKSEFEFSCVIKNRGYAD